MAFIRSAFKKYPLISNCVIYGSLYITAEMSQQTLYKRVLKKPDEEEPPYNMVALKNLGIISSTSMAPMLYFWYKWLDKKFPGTAIKIVTKKWAFDQFLMTPILLATFYVGLSLLERRDDPFLELRQKFLQTYGANVCFWTPTQFINFLFIPPQFRVVYIGCCSLLWANILCFIKRG